MPKKRAALEDVVDLTRRLMEQFCAREFEEWFSRLAPQCIWAAMGEQILIGAEAIKSHFERNGQTAFPKVLQDDYYRIDLGPGAAQVMGRLLIGRDEADYHAAVLLTMTYRLMAGDTKIVSHHFTYEFVQKESRENVASRAALTPDAATRQFVRTLMERPAQVCRIPVKSGDQTLYIAPNTILYISTAAPKKTVLNCMDQVVTTTATLTELLQLLPREFYQIHRCHIVNTRYVTALRRYEVELVNHIKLPVPALTYMEVKTELKRRTSGEEQEE